MLGLQHTFYSQHGLLHFLNAQEDKQNKDFVSGEIMVQVIGAKTPWLMLPHQATFALTSYHISSVELTVNFELTLGRGKKTTCSLTMTGVLSLWP